jgi:hypothetical protein
MTSNTFSPKTRTSFLATPSTEVGGDVRKNRALNCTSAI